MDDLMLVGGRHVNETLREKFLPEQDERGGVMRVVS